MKINYCKLVEDIMPLYCDKLTSDETNDFIKLHLEECSDCSRKYENPCGDIPVSQFDIVEDTQEDKFKSAKKFLLKVRKQMYLVGVLALIIVFLASTGSYLYGAGLNKDAPIKVKSADDFANRVVPGWQRALKEGQVVGLGISKPIPGTAAVVTFDKVWYTPSYTYVLYTVKEPNKKYLMAFARDIDIAPDKNMKGNSSMEPLGERFGGISPEGYHQIMVFMGYNTPVPSKEITLTTSNWMPPKIAINSDKPKVQDDKVIVTLPLSDAFLAEKTENIKVSKNYDWGGRSLRITGIDVNSFKTKLYGEIKLKQGEKLQGINGTIKCGKQSTSLSYESINPGDEPDSFKFVFYGNPLSEWPGDVSLELSSIEFTTPGTLTLPVDWSQYADKKGRVNVPESQDAAVSFFDSTVRLWYIEPENFINMEIVQPKKKAEGSTSYITMAPKAWIAPSSNYAQGIKVTNENGQILSLGGSSEGNIGGNDKVGIGIGIDNDDTLWKSSRKITVTITNPIAQLVVNEKIDIN